MTYWIDSHSHLTFDDFKDNIDEHIQRAFDQNVKRMMCVCLNIEQLKKGFDLKEKYPFMEDVINTPLEKRKERIKEELYQAAIIDKIIVN